MVALLVGNAVEVYLMELVVEPDILAARRTLPLQTEVYYRNYSSAINKGSFTNYVNRLGGGVSKMFTLLCNPYLVNWFTRGEEGVKIGQNLVHVVCERPLIRSASKN